MRETLMKFFALRGAVRPFLVGSSSPPARMDRRGGVRRDFAGIWSPTPIRGSARSAPRPVAMAEHRFARFDYSRSDERDGGPCIRDLDGWHVRDREIATRSPGRPRSTTTRSGRRPGSMASVARVYIPVERLAPPYVPVALCPWAASGHDRRASPAARRGAGTLPPATETQKAGAALMRCPMRRSSTRDSLRPNAGASPQAQAEPEPNEPAKASPRNNPTRTPPGMRAACPSGFLRRNASESAIRADLLERAPSKGSPEGHARAPGRRSWDCCSRARRRRVRSALLRLRLGTMRRRPGRR